MTDYTVTDSVNYAAEVVTVHNLVTLEGLDNLRGLPINGYQALVSKDTEVGTDLVVFPAESQLTHEFASSLNLYRHSNLNADTTKTGYLEDNRRVKAIRLRGYPSNALAIPVSEFTQALGLAWNPPVGVPFDTVDGVQISQKYHQPRPAGSQATKAQEKVWTRVDNTMLPLHFDSENYWRNKHMLRDSDHVTVTQKLHGSSVRIGNVLVRRKLSWWERLAKKFGAAVQETEYAHVYGSRKVVKDVNNPDQNHYYDFDLWSAEGAKYDDLIPEGIVVYGELIGWAQDSPIQSKYTYDVPQGRADLYVYRVAVVTPDAHVYDLSWKGVEQFCAERGLNTVPLLWQGEHKDFDAEEWLDTTYHPTYAHAVPLSEGSPCDEGVCVRREGILPLVLKAKSPVFLGHESKMLDAENSVDMEESNG